MNEPIADLIKHKLNEYATHGYLPGRFLASCLENNAMHAICRADAENSRSLRSIMQYIYNHLPSKCWGSPEKVTAWCVRRGDVGPLLDAVEA